MDEDLRVRAKTADAENRAALFRTWRKTLRLLRQRGNSEVEALAIFLRNNLKPPIYLEHKGVDRSQNQSASWYINNMKVENADTERWLKLASGALQLASMWKQDFDRMRGSIDALTNDQMPKELRDHTRNLLSQFEKFLEKRTGRKHGGQQKIWRQSVIKDAVDLAMVEFKKTEAAASRLVSQALFKIREGMLTAEGVRTIHKEITGGKTD